MTRKKWNRLRRQRPELFKPWIGGHGWEISEPFVKHLSKAQVIAILSGAILDETAGTIEGVNKLWITSGESP